MSLREMHEQQKQSSPREHTWNACPKTAANEHGAYEDSMIDTHVKIADKPLEILKVIHSFDPCLACATHLYNKKGEKIVSVNTDALCK